MALTAGISGTLSVQDIDINSVDFQKALVDFSFATVTKHFKKTVILADAGAAAALDVSGITTIKFFWAKFAQAVNLEFNGDTGVESMTGVTQIAVAGSFTSIEVLNNSQGTTQADYLVAGI